MRVCLCELAGRAVAIPVAGVEEVFTLSQLTPVPGAPAWVLGATSRRGRVLPVLWPTELPGPPVAQAGRSVLVLRDGELLAAIPIDATHGIQDAAPGEPGEPGELGRESGSVVAEGRSWELVSPSDLASAWRQEVAAWTVLGDGLS